MTILKRMKVPMYYLKQRKNDKTVELVKFDRSLYVRADDMDIIDVTPKKGKEVTEEQKPKQKKVPKKSSLKGGYKARICFSGANLSADDKKTLQIELSDALSSKKAHTYFKNLIVSAMKNAEEVDSGLIRNLSQMERSKNVYHFRHRSTSKQSILYTIVPNERIPKRFANSEMIENFLFNVAHIEVAHIAAVKSVSAKH